MKINLKTVVTALCAAGVVFGFAACVDQNVKTLGTGSALIELRIGEVTAAEIPAPISANAWESETGIAGEDFKGIQFNKPEDITGARIRPYVSKGAIAEWGIGTRASRPAYFYDTRVPATFEADDFIYIKVSPEDQNKENISYYRYSASVFSWVNDLASVSIAVAGGGEDDKREAKAGAGALAPANATASSDPEYQLSVTETEAAGATVTAVTFDPNATVRFARRDRLEEIAIEFHDAAEPITFTDQDFLYVEVTAENTIDKKYFKFRVNVGRMTGIKSLRLTTKKGDISVYGLGLPSNQWASVGPGSFQTAAADQPSGGFPIAIDLEDSQGLYFYKVVKNVSTPLTNNADYDNRTADFESGDIIAIMVRSKNAGIRSYYHIKVTLLAANIIAQPASTWYYADYVTNGEHEEGKKPVAPLTIVFEDGTDESNFTYQWYESDSLFGIYGRHGMSIDEKNNISTINGGPDMYYYLVKPGIDQMGRPAAVGATSFDPEALEALAWEANTSRGPNNAKSYTPRNDWKNVARRLPPGSSQNSSYPYVPSSQLYKTGPSEDRAPPGGWEEPADNHVNFFTGSTSEVRYYWVVVTDTVSHLTVTSDMAVILTEASGSMNNFIFDLAKLPFRKNVAPFTKLRELYKINIPAHFFPEGFDPANDFQVCIAQAQYFLPDGRPWTQNWTHGDFHFGYNEGSPSYIENGGPLTWWQNNLGANAGAIPLHTPHSAQGGLNFPPDWVGFAPSGDKGRGLPPTDANGNLPIGLKPAGFAEGQAQGYFCGFIELMEVRFATAPK